MMPISIKVERRRSVTARSIWPPAAQSVVLQPIQAVMLKDRNDLGILLGLHVAEDDHMAESCLDTEGGEASAYDGHAKVDRDGAEDRLGQSNAEGARPRSTSRDLWEDGVDTGVWSVSKRRKRPD
jgi:hypothetical protein